MSKGIKSIFKMFSLIAPWAYMGLIWYLSSRPSDAVVNFPTVYDNLIKESLHLIEFGILYGLLILFWNALGGLTKGRIILSIAIAVSYGAVDELHQSFIPERSMSLFDFIKDVIGIFIAWYLINHLRGTRKFYSRKS